MTIQKSFYCRTGLLALILACGVLVYGQEREEVRRTFTLNPGATVSLSNISGNITITSWAASHAEMVAVKTGAADKIKEVNISVEAKPSHLNIETDYPKKRNNNVSVSFDLKVPRDVNLDGIISVSGDIKMTDIGGRVVGRSVSGNIDAQRIGKDASLDSVSGDVSAADVADRASVSTVSGNIHASNIKGDLATKSVSGDIQITGRAGYIKGESVSGNVSINDSFPSSLKVTAVSGDLRFDGKLNASGRYELESHSGSVTVNLPSNSGFTLEASTFSGSIKSDFDIKIRGLNGAKSFKGIVNAGGPTLKLNSFSGTVSIRRK